MQTNDLFLSAQTPEPLQTRPGAPVRLAKGAVLLKAYAHERSSALMALIDSIVTAAPWRHMATPGGFEMSVAMSNCGTFGWVSDRTGYRYAQHDPLTGQPWPPMPQALLDLAGQAARMAGYVDFVPDACLINRYAEGARMGLHQDKDEQDMSQPIVSVSLGLPAIFQFGGLKRADKVQRILLEHGDVVVWGGPDRLRYHGIQPLKPGQHALTGPYRFNLTLRKAC